MVSASIFVKFSFLLIESFVFKPMARLSEVVEELLVIFPVPGLAVFLTVGGVGCRLVVETAEGFLSSVSEVSILFCSR